MGKATFIGKEKKDGLMIETLYLIGLLWFAHNIGDMTLQSKFISDTKATFWYSMFSHVFTWTMMISLVLAYFGIFNEFKFSFLFIGHWVMDAWKSRQPRNKENLWKIYVDQGWHFIQIVLVAVL